MLKRILFALMLCVGIGMVAGNSYAGSYGVGAKWNLGYLTERSNWGIRGYIVIEPNGLYQEGKGIIYHTHANGAAWSPETIARYAADGTSESELCRLRLMMFRWLPAGRVWTNMLTGEQGTGSAFMSPHLIVCKNSNYIEADMQPYVKDLFVGVESKKVIYFESIYLYNSQTSTWCSTVALKNNVTGYMDVKWHYHWTGTRAENYDSSANGHNQHAGIFELFNTSPYGSSFGKSGGDYQMDLLNYSGQWIPFDSNHNMLLTENNDGWVIYNANPVPGFWLAKVP